MVIYVAKRGTQKLPQKCKILETCSQSEALFTRTF
jgi:hypothetical protein